MNVPETQANVHAVRNNGGEYTLLLGSSINELRAFKMPEHVAAMIAADLFRALPAVARDDFHNLVARLTSIKDVSSQDGVK
ncbi:MAG TPA: hypothetical protein VGI03_07930 [Verrucomicrobiae bacterium]|jgi:hypothetical protein